MRDSFFGPRRAALIIGFVAIASSAAPSAVAAPLEVRVPNRLSIRSFDSDGTRVNASSDRGLGSSQSVCAWASRVTEESGFRILASQDGCSDRLDVEYRFDPAFWTAHVKGTISQTLTRGVYEFVDGTWELVSLEQTTTTADVDLSWAGHGPPRPVAGASGFPGSCYALPPICTRASAGAERSATVSGSLAFHGLEASFDIPEGHAGTMGLRDVSI